MLPIWPSSWFFALGSLSLGMPGGATSENNYVILAKVAKSVTRIESNTA